MTGAGAEVAIGRMYYNEKPAIERTHPKQGHTLYFDGRFPSFEKINDSDYSTDGSNELIATFPNAEHHECAGYITEKLTALFKAAGRFDALVLLSCDEWIEGDWPLFCKNVRKAIAENPSCQLFNVRFIVKDKAVGFTSKPRLFVDTANMATGEKHWHYVYRGRRINTSSILGERQHPPVQGITIYHDSRIRPQWRDDLMTKYQMAAPQEVRDAPPKPPHSARPPKPPSEADLPTRNKRILRQMGLIK